MMLKKPKEQVLEEIQARAAAVVYNDFANMNMRVDTQSVTWTFQQAIAKAVAEGFRVLLENQYSDEMFENDIGLKP